MVAALDFKEHDISAVILFQLGDFEGNRYRLIIGTTWSRVRGFIPLISPISWPFHISCLFLHLHFTTIHFGGKSCTWKDVQGKYWEISVHCHPWNQRSLFELCGQGLGCGRVKRPLEKTERRKVQPLLLLYPRWIQDAEFFAVLTKCYSLFLALISLLHYFPSIYSRVAAMEEKSILTWK